MNRPERPPASRGPATLYAVGLACLLASGVVHAEPEPSGTPPAAPAAPAAPAPAPPATGPTPPGAPPAPVAAPAPAPFPGPPPPVGYQAAPGAPLGYPPASWPPPDPRPRYLPFVPGEPAPPGYVYDERARRGPIIGGLITFAVPYSLGLLVAAQDGENKKGLLAVPWFGPWLTLLARDSSCDQNLPISDCTEDFSARLILVIDGILQTGGGIIAASGFLNPQKRYIRSDWAPQVSLLPRLVGRRPGLGVFGVF